MKQIAAVFTLLVFTNLSAKAQATADKAQIYQAIIEKFVDNNVSVINETLSRIYKYDIDGDYDTWFYKPRHHTTTDTSDLVGTAICVMPIQYSQTVTSYFASKSILIDTTYLLRKADDVVLDSLSKYISNNKIISWKKSPLSHSWVQNLFKKKAAVSVSNILFDQHGENAIVKMWNCVKNKTITANQSKIVLLKKADEKWIIADTLNVKTITM